jgi:hypothetical protein
MTLPDTDERFSTSGPVRVIYRNPNAYRMPVVALEIPPLPGAGRPSHQRECIGHEWTTKGKRQYLCVNCGRTVVRHRLPEGAAMKGSAR